jgi:hypothetical protein
LPAAVGVGALPRGARTPPPFGEGRARVTAAPATHPGRRRAVVALLLFAGLFAVYLANWTVLDEGDAVPSMNLPVALLAHGRLSFDPEHFPELFKWKAHPPFYEKDDFFFTRWSEKFGDQLASEWEEQGKLEFNGPRYYVVRSPRQHTYVSTFGPVPGLMFLPVALPFYAVDHEFATKLALRDSVAKLGSAMMVALTAVLLFLVAEARVGWALGLFVALAYGVGTCAWAISSQNLWQQTVVQVWLMTGAYFTLSNIERKYVAALAGFAFGVAVACRPTSAVAVLAVLVYLYFRHRGSIAPFLAGLVPAPLAVLAYNQHYFGSAFSFAQAVVGHEIAVQKTGSPDVWQTPLWQGAFGLLLCPSRGLLVFSPILGAAFWGITRAVRGRAFPELWPFFASALVLMAIQCKWFDWWGGHAYGYRPWLDAVPYLSLGLVPVVETMTRAGVRRAVSFAVLAWSVFVQGLGAMSYDRYWNLRRIFVTRIPGSVEAVGFVDEATARRTAEARGGNYLGPTFCDIDYVFCRHRLWSFEDNLIRYQMKYFALSRSGRLPFGFDGLGKTQ